MPNFGSLCKDLIGATLSIKGKKIIDANTNATFANVTATKVTANVCGNITGETFTGNLVGNLLAEETFADGNVVVGDSLTVMNDADVCGVLRTDILDSKSGNGIAVVGNLMFDVVESNVFNVSANLEVCGHIITDSVVPKTGNSVQFSGNVAVPNLVSAGGSANINVANALVLCQGAYVDDVYAKSGPAIDVNSPLELLNNNISNVQSISVTSVSERSSGLGITINGNTSVAGEVRPARSSPGALTPTGGDTSTVSIASPAGYFTTHSLVTAANGATTARIAMSNPFIRLDSVILGDVRMYNGAGKPLVMKTEIVSAGMANFWLVNVDPGSNLNASADVHFLIA